MSVKTTHWTKRLDFSMLSVWLLLSISLAATAYLWFGVDFRGYYAATRVLSAGGNPYDYDLVARVLEEVTGEMGNNPYYYPPWFAWLFLPLVQLPFQTARAIWMIFNVVLWNISLWQLGTIVGWPRLGWPRYALFALMTFSFAWITWRYEQAGILVFAILVALLLAVEKRNWMAAGIWMALLSIKPNVTFIVLAGISLWLMRKGHWRTVLVMALALLILLAIATLITPDWYQPFFRDGFGRGLTVALDGPDRVVAVRINTTFLDWLRTLGVAPPLRPPIYGTAIFVGGLVFLWSVFRAESFLELTSILLLVSLALTPYALQYDYPPLVIALLWGLSKCASSPKALAAGCVLAGFVFSVLVWQQNISWAYWMVIGLIPLATLGLRQAAQHEPGNKKTASG